MADPEATTTSLGALGGGTIGAILMALIGVISKLVADKQKNADSNNATVPNNSGPSTAVLEERIKAQTDRIDDTVHRMNHLEQKVNDVALDAAKASAEIGVVASSLRKGASSGRP